VSESRSQAKVLILPEFLPSVAGRIFTLVVQPEVINTSGKAVIFFPPFAEEMNKSRRMVSLQARALAREGYTVAIPDLYGTGDSQGDFGEALLGTWLADITTVVQFLKQKGYQQFVFWGLRFGVLLQMLVLQERVADVSSMLLWQPVLKGEVMMTQFLRLRLAADMMQTGEKITTSDMRRSLQNGDSIEVAGYMLTPELVHAIDGLSLESVTLPETIPVHWFEVTPSEERPIPVASQRLVERWQGQGVRVTQTKVVGEPFWNTIEIAEVPKLISLTKQAAMLG